MAELKMKNGKYFLPVINFPMKYIYDTISLSINGNSSDIVANINSLYFFPFVILPFFYSLSYFSDIKHR